MRRGLQSLLGVVLGATTGLGCADGHCRQAVEERTRTDPAFPAEEFLRACRKLPASHAACTVPSYATSWIVRSESGCREAYANPDFPREILLRPRPSP